MATHEQEPAAKKKHPVKVLSKEESEKRKKELQKAVKKGTAIKFPQTPPKANTAEETDQYLKESKSRFDKFLSILNENGGELVPFIFEEINTRQEQNPETRLDFWEVLRGITNQEPAALEILEAARTNYHSKNELLEKNAELVPFIKKELRKVKKDPEFNNVTIWDIIEEKETGKKKPKSKAKLILERAETSKKEYKKKKAAAKYRTTPPQINNTVILNDAVSHAITKKPNTETELAGNIIRAYDVNQAPSNQKVLKVTFALTYKGDDIRLSKPTNMFDIALDNAIAAISLRLKAENNNNFVPFSVTPEDIWRAMVGKNNNKITPTPEQRKRIIDAIEKARFTNVTGDISEEIEKHNLIVNDERIVGGKFSRYRLNANWDSLITEKGNVLDCITINEEQILLTYNLLKVSANNDNGHVLYLPLDLIDTDDNDGNTIEVRTYLLDRIMAMYHNAKLSRKINYDHMYQSGVESPEARISHENSRAEKSKADSKNVKTYQANIRKARAKDRQRVKKILEKWIEKGFIAGYEEVTEKNIITGVTIKLSRKPPQLES